MSESNLPDGKPAAGVPPPSVGTKRVLISLGTAIAALLFPFTLLISAASYAPLPCDSISQVQLAVGSENAPFFNDSRVQQIFLTQDCLDVQVTQFGSRQLPNEVSRYDGFVPSSRITAEQLQSAVPSLQSQPKITLFRSVLAIATYQPIVACLNSLGIAYKDSQGIWDFRVAAYRQAVQNGWSWSACRSRISARAYQNLSAFADYKILLTTTNPQCSNSGELFVADASAVADKGSLMLDTGTAADASTAVKVGGMVAPMITEQGFMENTTDVVFNDYLTQGIGATPMALIYESEFLGEEINHPDAMSPDMVLMYLTPTVFSERVLIPRNTLGRTVANDFLRNKELQWLAQEEYGFRISNPGAFEKIMVGYRIFGRKINVPSQINSGPLPEPNMLEDIINAINPPAPKAQQVC